LNESGKFCNILRISQHGRLPPSRKCATDSLLIRPKMRNILQMPSAVVRSHIILCCVWYLRCISVAYNMNLALFYFTWLAKKNTFDVCCRRSHTKRNDHTRSSNVKGCGTSQTNTGPIQFYISH